MRLRFWLRAFGALLMVFSAISIYASTKVITGSTASYVYSPKISSGTVTAAASSSYGCYKVKMDPSLVATLGGHSAYSNAQFQNLEITGWGVVNTSVSPPTFTGIIHSTDCYQMKSTFALPGNVSCSNIQTRYGRCTDAWTGSSGSAGEGKAACVYYLASSYLASFYYIEVADLPVAVTGSASNCFNPDGSP